MTKLSARLRELRLTAGRTQGDVADDAQITQGYFSKLEKGDANPTRATATALAKALRVSLWALVGGTEYADFEPTGRLVSLESESGVRRIAYFASALTKLSDAEREAVFADATEVRAICQKRRIYLYEPRLYTDPVNNPNVSAEDVYSIDRTQVIRSHLVILYGRYPSFGAGQEVEIATQAGIPIILLRPGHARISRMVHGCFARLHEVAYDSSSELATRLDTALEDVANELVLQRNAERPGISARLKELLQKSSLSVDTLAKVVGTTPRAINDLLSGAPELRNPSLLMLIRLATALESSVSYLVDGMTPSREETDPTLRISKQNLFEYARTNNLHLIDVENLWRDYCGEYDDAHRHVAEARSEPLTVEDWDTRFRGETQAALLDEDEDY